MFQIFLGFAWFRFLKRWLTNFAGGTMVPISWTEMQCPLTGQVEPRKVAKVEA